MSLSRADKKTLTMLAQELSKVPSSLGFDCYVDAINAIICEEGNNTDVREYINKIRTRLFDLYQDPAFKFAGEQEIENILFRTLIALAAFWPLNDDSDECDASGKPLPQCYITLESILRNHTAYFVSGHLADKKNLLSQPVMPHPFFQHTFMDARELDFNTAFMPRGENLQKMVQFQLQEIWKLTPTAANLHNIKNIAAMCMFFGLGLMERSMSPWMRATFINIFIGLTSAIPVNQPTQRQRILFVGMLLMVTLQGLTFWLDEKYEKFNTPLHILFHFLSLIVPIFGSAATYMLTPLAVTKLSGDIGLKRGLKLYDQWKKNDDISENALLTRNLLLTIERERNSVESLNTDVIDVSSAEEKLENNGLSHRWNSPSSEQSNHLPLSWMQNPRATRPAAPRPS